MENQEGGSSSTNDNDSGQIWRPVVEQDSTNKINLGSATDIDLTLRLGPPGTKTTQQIIRRPSNPPPEDKAQLTLGFGDTKLSIKDPQPVMDKGKMIDESDSYIII